MVDFDLRILEQYANVLDDRADDAIARWFAIGFTVGVICGFLLKAIADELNWDLVYAPENLCFVFVIVGSLIGSAVGWVRQSELRARVHLIKCQIETNKRLERMEDLLNRQKEDKNDSNKSLVKEMSSSSYSVGSENLNSKMKGEE